MILNGLPRATGKKSFNSFGMEAGVMLSVKKSRYMSVYAERPFFTASRVAPQVIIPVPALICRDGIFFIFINYGVIVNVYSLKAMAHGAPIILTRKIIN